MSIDYATHPNQLFLNELLEENPDLKTVKLSDCSFRSLMSLGGLNTQVMVDIRQVTPEREYDYVKFTYPRVPLEEVYRRLDFIAGGDVDVVVPASNKAHLVASSYNFGPELATWHRYSHDASGVQPAKPADLNGWFYRSSQDETINNLSSISPAGAVSDSVFENYEHNVMITSNTSDDDVIGVVIGFLKKGEFDDKEHVLTLVLNQGGVMGPRISVVDNYGSLDQRTLYELEPELLNPQIWQLVYGHVKIIKSGRFIRLWAAIKPIPVDVSKTRNEILYFKKQDLIQLSEDEMMAQGYKFLKFSLEEIPKYNRPLRFGYMQDSQAGALFSNIKRPGSEASITQPLKDMFLYRYGFNLGDDGATLKSNGADVWTLTVDNLTYLGKIRIGLI